MKDSVEQFGAKMTEAESLRGQALTIAQVCERLGLSGQMLVRWRLKYGALKEDEAERLSAMDISMLEDLQRGRW